MRTFISLLVILMLALPVWASEPSAREEAIEVLLRTSVESKDIRQLGYVPRAEPVLRTELNLKSIGEWCFGVTGLAGLSESREEGRKTPSDEVDLMFGKKWRTGQLLFSADLVYLAPRPISEAAGDILYPRLRLGAEFDLGDFGKLKPYIQGELRFSLPELVRRPVAMIGTDYNYSLGGSLSLKAGVSVLYDHGVVGVADTGWILAGRLGLEYLLSDSVSAELFIRASEPYQLRDRQTEHSVGFALSYKF